MSNNHKINSLPLGLALGAFVPIIALCIYTGIMHGFFNPVKAYGYLRDAGMFANLIKLAALINLPIFFLFINLNKLSSAKGVLIATLVYALYILSFLFG